MTRKSSSSRGHTREITPRILMRYIESCGWERVKFGRNDLAKFRSPGPMSGTDERAVILIPSTEEVFDYNKITNIALRRISAFEGRSVEELLDQLSIVSDSMEVRIKTPDAQKGGIPIYDGIALYQSLRDLLIYSLCSELDPAEKAFPRKMREAVEIVKSCSMGQITSGGGGAGAGASAVAGINARKNAGINSAINAGPNAAPSVNANASANAGVHCTFSASVHIPLPKRCEMAVDGEILEPIQRRSILRILRGVRDLEKAATLKDPRPITENFPRGLNSNMCYVLIEMIDLGAGTDLGISADLDPMYAIPDDVTTKIKLSAWSKSLLQAAAAILEEDPPQGQVELTGYVTQLRCDAEKGGAEMEIRMKAFGIEGHDAISVKMLLDERSYQLAIDAHKENNKIRIEGVLEKTGRGWTLNRPRRLEVMDRDYRGRKYKNLDSF